MHDTPLFKIAILDDYQNVAPKFADWSTIERQAVSLPPKNESLAER